MRDDWRFHFIFVAALFHMRKLTGKHPELWRMFWDFYIELGSPPLPMTAPWCQR